MAKNRVAAVGIAWAAVWVLGVSTGRGEEPPASDRRVTPAQAPGATTPTTSTAPAPAPTTPGPVARGTTAAPTAAETAAAAAARRQRARTAARRYGDTPVMQADQPPPSLVRPLALPPPPPAPNPGVPPVPPPPPGAQPRKVALIPWLRGFKIADNQSPRPEDRVFVSFNYFNDLNGSINRRLNADIHEIQVFRELLGAEKTFLDGDASIGVRLPINSITAGGSLGGASTAVGNFSVFGKYALWRDDETGSLISAGLAVTSPTGPTNFAGARFASGFRDAQLQPFAGYIWKRDRLFLHGFEAIDVPTDSNDVTMLYNDVGLGYYLFQSDDSSAFLRAIVPTFETHINIPLNHRGSLLLNDPAGTPDIVDLTFGVNFFLRDRSVLSIGFVDPVTGPRPFNYEWVALLNVYFGRSRRPATPPVLGP